MTNIEMEDIYRQMPKSEIPWDMEEPPTALVELVTSGTVRPCKTVDLGCGIGNYALYLASQGFEVTGLDISPTAISMAKENAQKRGLTCNFITADLLDNLNNLKEQFDFTPYFIIDELKTIEIKGKKAPHLAIYAMMSRK